MQCSQLFQLPWCYAWTIGLQFLPIMIKLSFYLDFNNYIFNHFSNSDSDCEKKLTFNPLLLTPSLGVYIYIYIVLYMLIFFFLFCYLCVCVCACACACVSQFRRVLFHQKINNSYN